MLWIIIMWVIIGQIINAFLGIKGIVIYLIGLFILTGIDRFHIISYNLLTTVLIFSLGLIILLLILLFVRKKLWGRHNLLTSNLFLSGLAITFVIGALIKPAFGLILGTGLITLPLGKLIYSKGFLGLIQLYLVSFIQWWGLLMINFYLLLKIIF